MKTALRSTLSLLFGILLYLCVIPAAFAEENRVAIDLDNFPDWRFCSYIEETFDKNYDGFLSEEECAAVTEMNCSHKQLTDITGIGYFKNLKKLNCDYSSDTIASIDLSGNPELEEFSCVNVGVSNLNLTENPKLIKLDCSMNYRRLTELDLSGNPLLEELDCSSCDLISLDLSNNSELKRLNCNGTELTELDLRANTKLEELSCGQCKMTELDVSANKQLKLISCGQDNLSSVKLCPHSALETLSCAYSKLTELDVSTQAELKELICYYNNLSALDVNANKKLESLVCGHNYDLRELDLKANTKLKWLDSTWTGFFELDVSSCPALVELWETGNIDNSGLGYTLWGGHQGDSSMLCCDQNVSILVIKGEESCGEDLSWTIYGSDTLMIEGSGAMYDFNPQSSPWNGYHERIKSVGLPNDLHRIGNNAFADFQALEKVADKKPDYHYYPDEESATFNFPSSLESIGQNAFANCVSLKTLVFHPSLTNIESGAFCGCTGIESVTLPASIKTVSDRAFSNCEKLASLILTKSVTGIGTQAFNSCDSLNDVFYSGTEDQWNAILIDTGNEALQNAVKHFGNGIIASDTSDELSWSLNDDGLLSISGNGPMYNISNTGAWKPYRESILKVVVESGITSISSNAFSDCWRITSAELPDGIAWIDSSAFSGCSLLENLRIPKTMTHISRHAFEGCDKLRDVYYSDMLWKWNSIKIDEDNDPLINATLHCVEPDFILPATLTTIESEAFAGGAFTYVQLPEGCTAIGPRTFAECPKLRYIYIPDGCAIDPDAFSGVSGLTILSKSGAAVETWAREHGYTFIPAT